MMNKKKNPVWKKAVLIILLVLPLSVYLLSVLLSGAVNFRTLEIVGPRQVVTFDDGTVDTNYYTIPDFSFTDHNGNTIDRETMKGRIYVATMFFTTCPTICPAMNFHLREVHNRLQAYKNIYYLSHTIDPEYDSVPILYQYAVDYNVQNSDKWLFVTGDKEEIFAMADAYFLAARQDSAEPGGYYHSQQAVLVDWEGRIRSRKDDNGNVIGAYNIGEAKDIDALVDDLRVLAREYREVKMGQ